MSGAKPYALNEAVVTAHDANLRASEVDAVFGAAGIENICDRACHADAIVAWYRAVQGLEKPLKKGVNRTVVEERLKNIVERRNQVAHRGGNPVDLLGDTAMSETLAFIESFSKSIFAMVVGCYLETYHDSTGIQLVQRRGDGPFQNGTIVIIDPSAHRIFRNQPVFVLGTTFGARWGRIRGLKIDNDAVDAVEPGTRAADGIGIELDFKCPKGTNLVALSADDEVVWNPAEG